MKQDALKKKRIKREKQTKSFFKSLLFALHLKYFISELVLIIKIIFQVIFF